MTNETKQTAVEWFGVEMGKLFAQYHGKKICIGEFHRKRFELEEQAKEMEKERMIKFCIDWFISTEMNIKEYYEQRYGGNK